MSKYVKLLELINADNPVPVKFDETNVYFTNLSESIGPDWNTKITINAVAGSGYAGTLDLFYKRINLADVGTGIWIFSETQLTEDLIITFLNDTRDTFLLIDDLDIPPIPTMRVGDIRTLLLTAKPDSVNWIGSNQVSTVIGFPGIAAKLSNFMNKTMAAPGYLS